jgi:alkylhydroperoxidase/carboxymuconolactone decarboxylase family protein YurZ
VVRLPPAGVLLPPARRESPRLISCDGTRLVVLFFHGPGPMVAERISAQPHPVQGMRGGPTYLGSTGVDPAEDLLRRLALNDEKALSMVFTRRLGVGGETSLSPKVELLVQLAALLAVGAGAPLLRETVAQASAEGATAREIVDVLVTVGPTVGLAGLVVSAPRLATAIGYDLENGHSFHPGEPENSGPAL